ncbi:hypothetical protein P4O66_014428 [Electrophorus voltai]|uniref:Uncharacterized protein n=1 Tax=Electrophorus voltai TaxID=2609070 RepID=A0AAD8Z2W9_9TELE|nr:hypothetical protein P4O66_014428 [Electrophorus voltai]
MALAGALLGVVVLFSDVCKTFGSGVFQTFNGTLFHVKSTCPFTLTRFTFAGVDCSITVQREPTGLMNRVVILVNKVTTILQNGVVSVEGNRITLPFDHTYQHVYQYGIYIMLKSKVLPFSVTWLSSSGGISSISDCEVMSYAKECRLSKFDTYMQLCLQNMFPKVNINAKCAFIKEIVYLCGNKTHLWSLWRKITLCQEPSCPGDLTYQELGPAFPPTCSNPQPNSDALINTCLPPAGMVVNDRADDFRSVRVTDCPCVHGGKTYAPGQSIISKCQSCVCKEGKWVCSPNACPPRCIIEGQVVTTFDGKQYSLPGKCTYVAAKGLSWTVTIKFSHTDMSIEEMNLDVYNERYTFAPDGVKLGDISIADLSQTEHATVFWQSSMFVQVRTSFGMKMQVQVSPEIQLYLYMPPTERTKGLCGTYNNNTEDDFTTSSGIIENSARPFASSWTVGVCSLDDLPICMNTNNEIFAEDKCAQLTNTSGVFASCHDYVPVNTIAKACVQRICQCTSGLQKCLCVALGNYAKACASQGIDVGDWRAASSCSMTCRGNLRFSYTTQACNRTCRSLSGPDPACEAPGDPVEGCSCLQGSHLNAPDKCSPRALCLCHYPGGTVPPGAHVIDGRKCTCEDGNLQCSKACGTVAPPFPCFFFVNCPHGKVCVHCTQAPVLTTQKTCKSLSQPLSHEENCTSGCYCPEGQYEDHNGSCVTKDKCTCEFSGAVYSSGQSVESNCRSCVCVGGKWDCKGEPCPGVCEVFGNGQYSTFDSKWYRFDGHCQYTLVEDASGLYQFAVRVESVPCCDEALTCSRSISVELQKEVTLTLRDMNVTQKMQAGWHLRTQPLYSVHTVGLHIIITVPELGLTVVWDKQTRVKVQLQARWKGRVRGLCGNFDGKVMNDLLTSSSSVVFGTLEFGNSWKAAVPPCSDATQEVFPCQRHSYCSAWAQRRCMIMHSDTFKDCHLKVDPAPYYEACVLESCSCEFEGKFLGFCTAVAAYAEACSTQNVCINWRTPDLCRTYPVTPESLNTVYCDYYNEEGQYSWHYEPCGQIKTCGKNNAFTGKLEGCYPRCPPEMPFYDENTRQCSSLDRCTCYFNSTVIGPGDSITTPNECWLVGILFAMLNEIGAYNYSNYNYTSNNLYINPTHHKYNRRAYNYSNYNYPVTTSHINPTHHKYNRRAYNSSNYNYSINNLYNQPHTSQVQQKSYNFSNYNYSINNLYINPTHHKYNRRAYNYSNYNYSSNNLYINPTHHKTTEEPTTPVTTTIPLTTLQYPTHHKYNRRVYNFSNYNYSINNLYINPTHHKYNRRAYNYSNYNYPLTTSTSTPHITNTTEEPTTHGTEWTEDCFRKACRNGVIEMRPVTCPPQIIPQCPRDLMLQVKDEQGCCDIWQCNCQCDVYGDPHYVSFSGTSFDFMDNCTYVLVEEIKPRHHLSIVVDNYYCNSELFGSCAKGIILKYLGSVVTLQVNDNEYTVEATLNDRVVQPPHEENGIRFESGDYQVSVYIDEIRSRVSLTPANTLEIILAMEHFYENTQGQCGICGGASCVRRSGQIESDDCCDKTAYHWIEEDPAKLYCAHAPRNVPCSPVSPSTMPSLPPTTPSCVAPLCDLLRHELFHECAKNIDMEVLVQNCRFDYCLARSKSSMCSPLEHLAEQCKKMGFCVYWRNLTNGICNVTCPEGMNFDECHRTTNDVCHGGVRVPGKVMDNFHSGCFCPDNQLLADKHKKICVSECTNCRGPLGEPMPVGATWESNCHVCTCNNQTQTEECWPKPPAPTPTCSENSTLVLDCCNNQICVEKTCEYNGRTFKVGDVWTDQLEPCITLHCTSAGTEIERRVCPQQSCSEGLRVWDEDQCCYTCNITCSVQESRMTVMVENCKQEVTLPICEGFCQSHSMWVRSGEVLQLQQDPQCCQESSYEIRKLSLSCGGAMPTSYSYKHITGCECKSAS